MPLRSGDAAASLGYLTTQEADAIEVARKAFQDDGKQCIDIVQRLGFGEPATAPLSLKLNWFLYIAALIVGAATFLLCRYILKLPEYSYLSWTGGVLGISRQLVLYIRDVMPNRHITMSAKISRLLVLLLNGLLFGLGIATVLYLYASASGLLQLGIDAPASHQRWFAAAGSVLLACISWFAINAHIRKSEVEAAKLRDHLHIDLLHHATACRAMAAKAGERPWLAHDVLTRIGFSLNTNPVDMFLLRIPVLSQGTRYSLWYLEPRAPEQNGLQSFHIVAVVAPGAPSHAVDCLDRVKTRYFPNWNEERVKQDLLKFPKANGVLPSAFKDVAGRDEYVSLTGFVFSRRRAVVMQRGDRSEWMTDGHRTILGDTPDATVRSFLSGRSFAAYPVDSINGTQLGVLIALRSRENAIFPEDQVTLLNGAKMLGIALSTE